HANPVGLANGAPQPTGNRSTPRDCNPRALAETVPPGVRSGRRRRRKPSPPVGCNLCLPIDNALNCDKNVMVGTASERCCQGRRTTMRMPAATCCLIFLTFWAQFDDVLLPCSILLPSSPFASEDDQYLSVKREQGSEHAAKGKKAVSDGLKPKTTGFFTRATTSGTRPEWQSARALRPPPLYVFMSLQL